MYISQIKDFIQIFVLLKYLGAILMFKVRHDIIKVAISREMVKIWLFSSFFEHASVNMKEAANVIECTISILA